jgi:nicotinamide-nucleotide amidase
LLRHGGHRIVFAESCTAGLVTALLGRVPGISEWLCGAMVVYQAEVKKEWLRVDHALLDDPSIGPVSVQVTGQLAMRILALTPHATLAAAVTGHLGPGAPKNLDGSVFVALATRRPNCEPSITQCSFRLTTQAPQGENDFERRGARQLEAAMGLIDFLSNVLSARLADQVGNC